MTNVVLVTDMLRGFFEEQYPLYCGPAARRIIPPIQNVLDDEVARGSRIFFIADHHKPDAAEFGMFPPHCIEGTRETEVIPELQSYPGEVIAKNHYSSFYQTPLDERLQALHPDVITVCGVCTDICVLHTVIDARNREYAVRVPVDCTAALDQAAGQWALRHMERVLGATIVAGPHQPPKTPTFDISPEIINGHSADSYFVRTVEILQKAGINPVSTMEVFARHAGVLCGIREVLALLSSVLPRQNREVWALDEGSRFDAKEVVLRIKAPYQSYGTYETAYLGMLSHCTGWATAAGECRRAAGSVPITSFGARHVHPLVAGRMEYAAVVGGCNTCASFAGADLAGVEAAGTMPHALVLVVGDTPTASLLFDKYMPEGLPRIALVDTFHDEPEESIAVARAMKGRLQGVRLDTPSERGRVTPDLVKETRIRLDQAGFPEVKITISGGIDPERIAEFVSCGAPVDSFGIGSYISGARPIDFTADLHEVAGKPIAKRGRIPGITPNPRLQRVL